MVKSMEREKLPYACGQVPAAVNKTGRWRFFTPVRDTRLSPCRLSCPLEGDIPRWLEAVKGERWEEAWQVMSEKNPFPAITGRVCFHFCEEECNRRQMDEGVHISAVEKAVGDWRHRHFRPLQSARKKTARVAVIGAGPAGLSCAFYLNREGYEVTVLDRAPLAGGLLALGIPRYRLSREVLDRELGILADSGVRFRLNCHVGADVPLDELYAEWDAVFVATGATRARRLQIPGEELVGVISALDFLRQVNQGREVPLRGPVLVIGGGNAAVDAARMALRQEGAPQVSLVYRRSREEMPAYAAEVAAAEQEGVRLHFNRAPLVLEGGEQVTAARFGHASSDNGRLRVSEKPVETFSCGTVIYAVGQEPDLQGMTLPRSHRLFAGGDLITGPSTVPAAIGAGRIAAGAIKAFLEDIPAAPASEPASPPVTFAELNLAALYRTGPPRRSEDAVIEAGRCLGCGTCNSCGACAVFCPDLAVAGPEGRYGFNLDYCKGCGICVHECPARALTMEGAIRHAG